MVQPAVRMPQASCRRLAPTAQHRKLVIARHGPGGPVTIPKGYLGDLRKAAIALHSREQLGKKKKATSEEAGPKRPPFVPKKLGYLRFLQESKVVFDCLETIVAQSDDPSLTPFKNNGLERGDALAKDLDWFTSTYGMELLPVHADGPGSVYKALLEDLAENDIPVFMCHYYNVNFAHTAGGRMIGKAVSDAILDGAELEFYKWDGDVKEIGDKVKGDLEAVAETWSEEDRKRSVNATKDTFSYSGRLLQCITQACDCDCPRED